MRATVSKVGLPLTGEGVRDPLRLALGELKRLTEQEAGGVVRRGVGIAEVSRDAGTFIPARPRAVEVLLALLPVEGELLALLPQQSKTQQSQYGGRLKHDAGKTHIDAQS